jgi:hypothetical protein
MRACLRLAHTGTGSAPTRRGQVGRVRSRAARNTLRNARRDDVDALGLDPVRTEVGGSARRESDDGIGLCKSVSLDRPSGPLQQSGTSVHRSQGVPQAAVHGVDEGKALATLRPSRQGKNGAAGGGELCSYLVAA